MQCEDPSEQTIARFSPRQGCALELRASGGGDGGDGGEGAVELRTAQPGAKALATGVLPSACERGCEFEIHATSMGPGVLIVEAQAVSGLPHQLWWGHAVEGRLEFTELFHGARAAEHGVDLGPPYVLAPADCAGAWGWVLRPRLGGADAENPDTSLEEFVSSETSCTDLGVPLP